MKPEEEEEEVEVVVKVVVVGEEDGEVWIRWGGVHLLVAGELRKREYWDWSLEAGEEE